MIRKIYLLVLFLSIALFPKAMDKDSLILVLKVSKNDLSKVNLAIKISNLFFYAEQYDSALKYINEAEKISYTLNDFTSISKSLCKKGIILKELGDYESSFNILLKSLRMNEGLDNQESIIDSYSALGSLFIRMRKYDKAEFYLKKALELALTLKESDLEIDLRINLGTVYVAQKKYTIALSEFSNVEKLLEGSNKVIKLASIYGNIGRIYSEQMKFSQAKFYFEKALSVGEKFNSNQIKLRAYSFLGKLYLAEFNDKSINQKQFDLEKLFIEAKYFIEKSYKLSKILDSDNGRCAAYEDFYTLYKLKGDYKLALNYFELYTRLNDSLLSKENNKSIADLNLKYETEKRDQEIKLLNKQKEQKEFEALTNAKNQKIVTIFLILLALSGVIIYYISFKNYKNKQAYLLEKVEKEKVKTEIVVLKNQISPHTTFNTLNSIFFQIDQDPEVAKKMTVYFSELLRYQLYESEVEFIEINKEISYLMKFIEMQRLRKSNRCKIEFVVEENVKHFKIAPLILIPLIENAFKYTTNDKGGDNYIISRLHKKESWLIFTCKNSSYVAKESINNGGIGLSNLRNRLKLIYPNKHELHIYQNEAEFNVKLAINV